MSSIRSARSSRASLTLGLVRLEDEGLSRLGKLDSWRLRPTLSLSEVTLPLSMAEGHGDRLVDCLEEPPVAKLNRQTEKQIL